MYRPAGPFGGHTVRLEIGSARTPNPSGRTSCATSTGVAGAESSSPTTAPSPDWSVP